MQILLWNTYRKPNLTHLALWARTEYDVIALTEAARSGPTAAPACPGTANYRMIYHSGRTVLYIHKRHGPDAWTFEAAEDYASVTFTKLPCRIITIYNPPNSRGDSPALRALAGTAPDNNTILLGDFNFHHPMWDFYSRESRGVDTLLEEATRLRVALATPFGTITREKKGERNSTLDLIWASAGLNLQYMGADYDLDGSDHIAQRAQLGPAYNTQDPLSTPTFNWKMTDPNIAKCEAQYRLRWTGGPLETEAQIDSAVDWLIEQLLQIAARATPMRKNAGPARNPWWNRDTAIATKQLKQARRTYQRTGQQADWDNLLAASSQQDQSINAARQACWRDLLATLTERGHRLSEFWKMEKWARLRSGTKPAPPQLPLLQRPENTPATSHADKAAVLARRFFPEPWADNEDIPPPPPEPPPAETNSDPMRAQIDIDDLHSALKNIQSWKAPGEDGIPAGFLKACGEPFLEILLLITNASIAVGHFPTRFRNASVTVIPKPNKTPE